MKSSSNGCTVFKRHEARYIGKIKELRAFGPMVEASGRLHPMPRYLAFRRDGKLAVAVRFADETQYLKEGDEDFETHSTIVFEIDEEK